MGMRMGKGKGWMGRHYEVFELGVGGSRSLCWDWGWCERLREEVF